MQTENFPNISTSFATAYIEAIYKGPLVYLPFRSFFRTLFSCLARLATYVSTDGNRSSVGGVRLLQSCPLRKAEFATLIQKTVS